MTYPFLWPANFLGRWPRLLPKACTRPPPGPFALGLSKLIASYLAVYDYPRFLHRPSFLCRFLVSRLLARFGSGGRVAIAEESECDSLVEGSGDGAGDVERGEGLAEEEELPPSPLFSGTAAAQPGIQVNTGDSDKEESTVAMGT